MYSLLVPLLWDEVKQAHHWFDQGQESLEFFLVTVWEESSRFFKDSWKRWKLVPLRQDIDQQLDLQGRKEIRTHKNNVCVIYGEIPVEGFTQKNVRYESHTLQR